MNNKKVISLAALLAIMAFAVVPTAAQALTNNGSPLHWQLNNKATATGVNIPVISWGTAKEESAAGIITCKNAAAANNKNEAGPVAHSEVILFASYECKATGGECLPPAEERATAFNLTPSSSPDNGVWPSVLQEEGAVNEGEFRSIDKSGTGVGENPVKVNIECYLLGEKVGNLLFKSGTVETKGGTAVGSSTPLVLNGTTATKPSETSFEDAKKETGHLFAPTEAELTKEITVEPTVGLTEGSPILKDEPAGKKWQTAVPGAPAAGCRAKAAKLWPNEIVNTVSPTGETLTLENKVNPGKNFGLTTTVEPVEFRCGTLVEIPLEGTTKGKFKFVGYLDNNTTPLVTVGHSNAP
jgi:hypothetical protein